MLGVESKGSIQSRKKEDNFATPCMWSDMVHRKTKETSRKLYDEVRRKHKESDRKSKNQAIVATR